MTPSRENGPTSVSGTNLYISFGAHLELKRPAAHVSAWRSGGRQLTWTITSPASASTNHIADTSGASRRGRARRPRGPTQAVLSACAAEHARRAPRLRRAPDRPAYFATTLNLLRSGSTSPHQS
ncbi:hypothetical protein EVAR_95415_1 [Eumeta japonica]|uniref:Uncharacterized protein n=1 Tax=Eumeta variegata TaxID=151549 RepID=A0A4C1VKW7_EUMVA|nr:hypothetical protein EVAR_95415_1 [Eumeta japonica]